MADVDEDRVSSVRTGHTEDQMESALSCKDTSKKLESSIFNHISLGQWEAARASLFFLANDPESRENAKELLKILVLEAANYWCESPAIPSPHHLSWLALDIYQTIFPDDKDKLPPYVQDLVEFRLLLYLTRGVTSFSTRIASQLCQYHAVHVLKIPGATPDTVSNFPSLTLDFIRDVITSLIPALGHTLITSLTVPSGMSYLPNNEALQMVYIECINECLETLEQTKIPEDVENDSSYDSQYESDHPTSGARGVYKACERILSSVYTLLSMMDPTQEMVRVTKKIDRIFHTLLKATFNISTDWRMSFNAGRIYSCLLGRSTPFLINRLHEVEEYLRMNKTTEESVTASTSPSTALEVPSPAKQRSSYTEISRAEWRDRFYQALYDHKHLLENVLDTGLQLVYTGKLQELSQLMSRPEYVPLRPILLLLGWDRYSAVSSGKELLDALWPMEVSMKQSLLFNGCCKLAFQVELVQWCLEKARPHVQTPSLLSLHRAGDMFKGLETHSTLYILHHSTPLASLDPLEIIDILKMRPRVPSLSSAATITPPPQFSRSATPMKSISDSDISPAPSPLLGGLRTFSNLNLKQMSLKPEQERDIAVYRSFYAMRLVLDAIWSSVQLANGIQPTCLSPTELRESPERETESSTQSQQQQQQQAQDGKEDKPASSKVARKLQLGEMSPIEPQTGDTMTSFVKDSTDISGDLYEQQVTTKLQEAKVYLSLIYPLNYRLEILENIFSLLFMTSEDIKLMLVDEGDGRSVAVHMKMESFTKSLSSASSIKGRDVASMLSSIALIKSKHGYLFDERMVSNLLDMLQDCIFEARAAKYVLTQQAEPAISDNSYLSHTAVRSAIPHTALQQRSAKLEQYITEARWRQQLVSSKHGITAGLGSKFKNGRNGRDLDWLSLSDDSMSEWSDSEDESNGKKEKRRTRKVGQAQQDSESGSVAALGSQTRSESQMDLPSSKSPTVGRSPSVGTGDKYSPVPKPLSVPLPSAPSLSSSMPAPRPLTLSPALSRTSPRIISSPKQKRKSKQVSSSRSKMTEGGGGSNTRSSSRQSQNSAVITAAHGDDDSGECADVEDKSPPKEGSTDKRRKRLRSRGYQSTNRKRRKPVLESFESNFTRSSVICRMLSSPGSLLRMCLKYDNYIRANEVLKMFGMEGQFGEAFVRFLEQYEQVSRELSQKNRSTIAGHKRSGSSSVTSSLTHSMSASHSHTPTKTTIAEETPSVSSSLPASQVSLQVAILNATSSSVALESLHKLLVSPSINQMLFSGDEHLERAAQDSAMLQDLTDHISALVMLDLMCSSRVDGQLAKRIVEQATSRCQEMLKTSHSRGELSKRGARMSQAHDIMLSGPFVLLQIIADVASSFITPTNHQYPTLTPHSSPHSLLTKFTHHLRASTIVNAKTHMDLYHTSREKVEGVLDQSQSELKPTATIFTELSQFIPNDDSNITSQLQFQADMFDDLIRTLSGNMHSPSLPSSPRERSLMRQSSLNGNKHTTSYDCPSALAVSYLKQFSRYLAKLVELLIKCVGTGTSNLSKGSLFHLVLKESPSHLLGKLVFEQGIKPQRLENMKGDFPHLRIVEVLVKCCCPQLPSLAAASVRALPTTPPVVALNSGEASGEDWDTLDPCAFSYKLLSKVVTILKDGAYTSLYTDGNLTSEDLISVLKNPELCTAFSKTPLLATIDLNHLNTPSKQMVFYSNITNLLYIHALMTYFTVATSNEGVEQGTSSLHGVEQVGEILRNCSNDITSCMLHSDKLVRVVYFTKVGYYIGQLGLVSCFDLHYSILRQSLTSPALSKGKSLETRLSAVKPDPWAAFALQSPDPRVLFIVHNSFLSSPIPKAVTERDLEECLKSCENAYLNSTVTVDVSKRELTVPQWLYDNQTDLVKQVWNEATSSTTSQLFYPELALFKYIYSKLDREKSDMLKPFLETIDSGKGRKLSVTVQPESTKFGYNFNMKKSSGTSAVRTSPKARRKRLSRQVSHKETTAIVVKGSGSPAQYTFTRETMAFVKGQAPLLAALVQLLCPPPGMGLEDETLGKDGSETAASKDEQDGGGRKSIMQSIRKSKPYVPTPKKPFPQGFDDGQLLSPWRRQFDKILAHFASFPPMKHYLASRLSCFESQLKWDSQSTGQKSSVTPTTPSGTKSPTETSGEKQQEEQRTTLRRLAALSASSPELGEACSFVMRKLLECGQAGEALKFLASEPASSHLLKLEYLKDIVISSAFVELKMKAVVLNPVSMLSQLSNLEIAVRLAFSSLSKWPVNTCVDVLTYFVNHLSPNSIYMSPVSKKLEKMTVYSRILSTCESPLPGYQWPSSKSPWKSWAELAGDSNSKPDYVLDILLASKVYSLVRKWVDVHELGSEFVQQIEVDYLFDLLEGSIPDSITAHQVLDSISDDKEKLMVCEALLKNADLQTTIFVLHYMLTRLPHCIPIAKNQDYCNKLLGAKALLSLPKSYQKQYDQLVAHPMLLVEQLVINLKIDWAGTVVQQLRSSEYLPNISKLDAPILDHTPMVMEGEESGDPFTTLLMFYSSKALEFPQPIMILSTPVQSLAASAYPTSPPSPSHHRAGGAQRFPRTPSRNVPPGDQPDPYSPYPSMTPRRESLSRTGRKWGSASVMSPTPFLTEVRSGGSYEPPTTPPTKEYWEKNAEVSSCRVCFQVNFGMFNRRHHCRRCGRIVCAGCSSNTATVKRYDVPVRVCDDCFPFCTSLSLGQNEDSSSQPYTSSLVPTTAYDTDRHASFSMATQNVKLIPHDLHFNQHVRTEFYFERTPDTALCLSLIDMIVNKRVAAAFILDCCHSVSLQLVPDSQGRVNEEVDHYFVIGLIQNLLLNAKLRYADAGDSSGVELCDTYLSRVDLLRLLVSSRYSKIPSIQELTNPDLARRVRDGLLQDDRFGLAMEVSTKCQLDTSVVWSAWGMACLKIGNFSNARNKFRLCFQVSSQSKLSSSGGQNLSLLHRIIEQIEQNPLSVTGRNTQYSEEWHSVVVGSVALSEKRSDDCDLDIYRFNECVYYLRTYGTHSTMVAFFVKHNYWMDACKYTLDMKCPTEIFVDHIWVPAFKTGLIEIVEECLKTLDSSLAAWEVYLTAACRFFTQRGLFSVLYRTQLFMQDFVRAALTCIKFYIGFAGRSTTISDLYSRLHYLDAAKRHFQDALGVKTRPFDQSRGGRSKGLRQYEETQRRGGGSGAKSMPVSELETHLLTVSMQAKVTRFLYGCSEVMGTLGDPLVPATSSGGGAEGGSSSATSSASRGRTPQQVPTLFGSGHMRGEVVVQLLTCSQDLIEGYQLAREIIQIYKIPPSKVYCDVSRNLALKQRYSDIRLLLQCVQKSQPKYSSFDALNDEIIMAAIKILASQTKEAKQVDKLVQLLTSDRSKIKAFTQCGKLKNAYLVAIKSSTPLVDEVRNISEIASKAGQLPVRDICEKWLQRKAMESPR